MTDDKPCTLCGCEEVHVRVWPDGTVKEVLCPVCCQEDIEDLEDRERQWLEELGEEG